MPTPAPQPKTPSKSARKVKPEAPTPGSAKSPKSEASTPGSAKKVKSERSTPGSARKVQSVNGDKLNGTTTEVKSEKVKAPKPNGTPAPPATLDRLDWATLGLKPRRKTRGARLYRNGQNAALAKPVRVPAPVSVQAAIVQESAWKPASLVGGSIGKSSVVFSRDSTLYMCVAGSRIKVYSATTGLLIRTLVPPVHTSDALTAIEAHAEDPKLIFSSSSTGTLRKWDVDTGKVLKTWEVGESITHLRINRHDPEHLYIISAPRVVSASGKTSSVLYKYSLNKKRKEAVYHSKKQQLLGLDIAADGSYIAVHSAAQCTLISVENPEDIYHCPSDIPITAVAIHPAAQYLAAGDFMGRITLWHCGSVIAKEKPVTSVLHWHPQQVNCAAFSADGEYLLSGADAGVLVVWQLSTRGKQFLPHLSSGIRALSISPDQMMYALTHIDNSVRIVASATMNTKFISAGPPTYDRTNRRPWQMVREPRDDSVAIFGLGGSIQFYDVMGDQRLQQLEVTSTETAAKLSGKPSSQVAVVTHVAFAANNAWMMTVDDRFDVPSNMWESRVKFWEYKPDSATYVMNTRVDQPHKGFITGVAASTKSSTIQRTATTGSDKFFRVWNLLKSRSNGQETWGCLYTGAYRDLVPEGASFSSDNSLLAVTFQQVVTLWSAAGSLLHSVMTAPSPVRSVSFLGGSGHVLSYSVWWSLRINIEHLAVDNASCQFAVITYEELSRPRKTKAGLVNGMVEVASRILIFEADSPTPIATFVRIGSCLSCAFLPKSSGTELVVLNEMGELETFVHSRATPAPAVGAPGAVRQIEAEPQAHALSSLYGNVAVPPPRADRQVAPKHASFVNAALQAPAHAHPPPTRFFLSTMELLLEPRRDTQAIDEVDTVTEAEETNGRVVNGYTSDDHELDGAEAYIKLEPGALRQMFKRVLTASAQ
ncbi:WD repeat-containing protein 75 [Geranomyces michiganensis]|nr:WD repeat-containing protein 75 [Geranomyces michiganensis]